MNYAQLGSLTIGIDTIVMLTLYLVLGIYAIFSGIFYYHWKTYGSDFKITTYTLIVYFATTIPLMIITTVLALIIS